MEKSPVLVMVNQNDSEDTVFRYLDYFVVYYFSLSNHNSTGKSQSDDMQLLNFVLLGKYILVNTQQEKH